MHPRIIHKMSKFKFTLWIVVVVVVCIAPLVAAESEPESKAAYDPKEHVVWEHSCRHMDDNETACGMWRYELSESEFERREAEAKWHEAEAGRREENHQAYLREQQANARGKALLLGTVLSVGAFIIAPVPTAAIACTAILGYSLKA